VTQLNLYDDINDDKYIVHYPYWCLYVLLLVNGDLYVGITRRSVAKRFHQHYSKGGSVTTKAFKPIQILKMIPTNFINVSNAAHLENRCVRLCNTLIKNRTTFGGYMYYKKSDDFSPL
jgi:predicted GIY-YIG superfamily endonuclease